MRQKLSEVDGLIALILSVTWAFAGFVVTCSLQNLADLLHHFLVLSSPHHQRSWQMLLVVQIWDPRLELCCCSHFTKQWDIKSEKRVWNVDYHTSTWGPKKRLSLMAETVNVWWLEVKLYGVTRSWKGIHYQLAPQGILVAPFLPLPLICSRLGVCGGI